MGETLESGLGLPTEEAIVVIVPPPLVLDTGAGGGLRRCLGGAPIVPGFDKMEVGELLRLEGNVGDMGELEDGSDEGWWLLV